MAALTVAERLEFVKLGFVTELEDVLRAHADGEKTAGAVWDAVKAFGRRSPGLSGMGAGAATGAALGSTVLPGVGTLAGGLIGGGVGGLGGQLGRLMGRGRSAEALVPRAMELMKVNPGSYPTLESAMASLQKATPEMGGLARAGMGTAALGAGALGLGGLGAYELGKGGLETVRDTISGGQTRGQSMGMSDILKALGMGAAGYYGTSALGGALNLPPEVQQLLPWLGMAGGGAMGLGAI